MMRSLFRVHGEFCAAHPLEVVVATVTIISSLISMGTTIHVDHDKVCGWNYECAKAQKLSRSDMIVLSFGRCVALVYIYMQFRNLRRLGAKHLLGISGVFTIFSSFVFCIAFVKMFGNTISGLYEALPFFLFLIDLSKASALAVFALSSTSREDIQTNIGKGMELLGPAITLDAIVETLAIGLGTISGVQQLGTMCSFGCLSVISNYVAFMTFYPACLSLVLELTVSRSVPSSVQEYKHMAEEFMLEYEEKKPNPVIQRVKIIMSAGLAVVHIHSRLVTKNSMAGTTDLSEGDMEYREPEMTIWQFYLYRMFAVHIDYGLTLLLGLVLLIKYVYVDRHTDLLDIKHTIELHRSMSSTVACTQTENNETTDSEENIRTSFSLGDDDDENDDTMVDSKGTQTAALQSLSPLKRLVSYEEPRSLKQCIEILKSDNGVQELTDDEVKLLVEKRHIPSYKLEGTLGDYERGVSVRRQIIEDKLQTEDSMTSLPFSNYDYTYVDGACCENVIGYMPLPVGVAGPLLLDGQTYMVPMATTEGCLVASTNRGCRALSQGDGVHSRVIGDGMSRGPAVRFPSAIRASEAKLWLENGDNFDKVKDVFNSTSRFARLQRVQAIQAGRLLYIRFVASTGDAMGMNMLSKGTEKVLHTLQEEFADLEIISLSGNICTDKKPSAINWIEGRGKSVVCEAIIPADVVKNTLKTTVPALVDLNISKNLIGSAMAGSIGGYNAHAANIVTAMFIATGQDPAQTVASSNCITLVEATGENNEDLYITCTMPSVEVGTVGGGTILPPQAACLKMLGVHGSSVDNPGSNAQQLARIVCGTVLAGELSLLSALAAGHLVRSHLKHNRSSISVNSIQSPDGKRGQSFTLPNSSQDNSCSNSFQNSSDIARLRCSLSHTNSLSSVRQNLSELPKNQIYNDKCIEKSSEKSSKQNEKPDSSGVRSRHDDEGRRQRGRTNKDDIQSCIKHVS
ncbi:3-hydroxy-3-methylglutaryl-coenzyme A reductase-like [Ruditapes philippinarum]|uniref:3-hydroxy-3-methylglutaryl-coenzyme A reductase-like n=1 Tax=Ruditapes philippinarum TaxID=129788 RepID=UPI00295A665A|nr:3-hydroxy-3-methylglutaryl-coenzyme A reductase-like [Ruditapes philippinarum]